MTPGADLLSTAEALEVLGLTDRSTISRWVQLGRITPVKRIGGRAFVFRRADVEALAAELGVKASA